MAKTRLVYLDGKGLVVNEAALKKAFAKHWYIPWAKKDDAAEGLPELICLLKDLSLGDFEGRDE